MRLDEVPELEDVADELSNLSVEDVIVRPVVVGKRTEWQALVILRSGVHSDCVVPWVLALRSSEAAARGAAVTFLRGVVQARADAKEAYAWSLSEDERPAFKERQYVLVDEMLRESDARAREAAVAAARERSRAGDEAAAAEKCLEALASAGFDVDDFERWRADFVAARKAAQLTQRALGERVGLAQAQVSQIERGRWVPPGLVLDLTSAELSIERPRRVDEEVKA